MTARLNEFRRRLSLQTLIVVVALVVAPAFGVAIAAAMRGQSLYFLVIGGFIGIFVTLYAPIELLLLAGVFGALLADSRFDNDVVYYGRFVPMGMLTIRTLLDYVLRREETRHSERTYLVPGMIFAGLAMFSSVWSLTPDLTAQRTISMLFVVISCGLGLPNYLTNLTKLNRALLLVVVLIAAFVLLGTLTAQGSANGIYDDQSFVRVTGFFANPNTQGLMAMLIFYPLVWWQQTTRPGNGKKILTGVVLIWAVLVLLTGSRSSLLGVLGGGLVLIWLYGRSNLRYARLLALALGLGVVVALVLPQFGRAFDLGNPSIDPATVGVLPQVDRAFLIQRAIELGMRSPIFGVGFSASDKVFADDHIVLVQQGIFIAGSHNSYTRMFVDLGIVGVLAGFPIFVIILGGVLTAPAALRRDPTVALMTAAVVSGLVNAFFEDWLFGFGSASTLPLWFFLALIPLRMRQLARETSPETERMPVAVEATA